MDLRLEPAALWDQDRVVGFGDGDDRADVEPAGERFDLVDETRIVRGALENPRPRGVSAVGGQAAGGRDETENLQPRPAQVADHPQPHLRIAADRKDAAVARPLQSGWSRPDQRFHELSSEKRVSAIYPSA